ncbi:hypothetical protein K443DRAFT_135706 [Laccaria amethystina LaAM-08-1]|uniref:Uncharacterized protein n=1 Tax=Laccaria amethystina LaAM-08-1 TaxID=1095629 RepID=A0A0C9WXH0_9AGAR|nr:hypothetical protein K443DRAFT_135706 [Laccaria amethystina LaAM-08-1]
MPVTQSQKLPSLNGPSYTSSYLKTPTRRLSVSPRYNPMSASNRCDLASPRGSSRTTSTRSLSSSPIPQQYPLYATTPIQRPPKRRAPVKRSQFPSGLPTLPSTSSPSLLGGPPSKCTQLPSTYQSPVEESLFASLRLQPPPGGTSRNHLFEVGDRVVVQKYYEEYDIWSERMQGRVQQSGHDRFCWIFLVDADNVHCYGKVGDEMWDTKGRVLPISARTLHPGRFVKELEIMLISVWVPAIAVVILETDSSGTLPLVVRPINGQDREMDFRTTAAVTQAAFESSSTTTVERYFHEFASLDLSSWIRCGGFIIIRRTGDNNETSNISNDSKTWQRQSQKR